MNIYVKVIVLVYLALYFIVSFFAWDLAWVVSVGVGGRVGFFFFGMIFSALGCATLEDSINDKKYKARN